MLSEIWSPRVKLRIRYSDLGPNLALQSKEKCLSEIATVGTCWQPEEMPEYPRVVLEGIGRGHVHVAWLPFLDCRAVLAGLLGRLNEFPDQGYVLDARRGFDTG